MLYYCICTLHNDHNVYGLIGSNYRQLHSWAACTSELVAVAGSIYQAPDYYASPSVEQVLRLNIGAQPGCPRIDVSGRRTPKTNSLANHPLELTTL